MNKVRITNFINTTKLAEILIDAFAKKHKCPYRTTLLPLQTRELPLPIPIE